MPTAASMSKTIFLNVFINICSYEPVLLDPLTVVVLVVLVESCLGEHGPRGGHSLLFLDELSASDGVALPQPGLRAALVLPAYITGGLLSKSTGCRWLARKHRLSDYSARQHSGVPLGRSWYGRYTKCCADLRA